MRRRTKVSVIIVIALMAAIPGTINFDGLATWPSESLVESLTEVKTADEAMALIGRRPDYVIRPNPGAKCGVEQWVWTKDRSTKVGPLSFESGWINVFVSPENLVLESECAQSPSFFAFLKDTGRDVLEKAGYPSPYPTPPLIDPDPLSNDPVRNSSDEHGEASQKMHHILLRRPCKAGAIKVIGNESTIDRMILRLVGLAPGQTLTENDLAVAEAALVDSGLFIVEEKNGIRPTVHVIDPEGPGEFKDVLVQVYERFQRR